MPSGGTTEETQTASRSSKPIPLRASSPAIRSASSSPVAPERVWKRQCSARSLAVEGAEVGLGVADVYREEHGAIMAGSEASRRARRPAAPRMPPVEARLFVIPASHPSIAAQLMLEHKGIAYKRTDLLPVISKAVLRVARLPGQSPCRR